MPDDGPHTALLEKAKLYEDDKGPAVITEWSADGLWWESWNRFAGKGLSFTLELLDGLGADRSKIADRADDDYTNEVLTGLQGITYLVTTKSREWEGRWYVNTYVDGPAVPTQTDLPIDTEGLPAVDGSGGNGDDGDVPF